MLEKIKSHFEKPDPFLSRSSALKTRPFPVPYEDGVYGLYIRDYPDIIHDEGIIEFQGFNLLYIGISPSRPGVKQKLDGRLKKHLKNDASRSTFRTSIGCVLADELGIQLQTYDNRLSFAEGEKSLNNWLDEHLRFTWFLVESPWLYEEKLLKEIFAPLNLIGNQHHSFYPVQSRFRKLAKENSKK